MVRMIKACRAGLFGKGMDLYFTRHDGHAATVEQFVQCFADAAAAIFSRNYALVFAGRHAGGQDRRRIRRARQSLRLMSRRRSRRRRTAE